MTGCDDSGCVHATPENTKIAMIVLFEMVITREHEREQQMVILAGVFTVDPDQRAAFVEGRRALMAHSRAEKGCIEYTFAADPLDPGRVVLFEKWESQEDLDAHLAGLAEASAPVVTGPEATSTSITVYDVTGERPLRR